MSCQCCQKLTEKTTFLAIIDEYGSATNMVFSNATDFEESQRSWYCLEMAFTGISAKTLVPEMFFRFF